MASSFAAKQESAQSHQFFSWFLPLVNDSSLNPLQPMSTSDPLRCSTSDRLVINRQRHSGSWRQRATDVLK